SNLQIKQVPRSLAAPELAESDLLAPRMDNYQIARIDYDPPQFVQRAYRKRIDDVERLVSGHLHEAETGVEGVCADELGVQPEAAPRSQVRAAGGQVLRRRDQSLGD